MLRRFVDRHGWEKWLDVDGNQHAVRIAGPVDLKQSVDLDPIWPPPAQETKTFLKCIWRSLPWPDEVVYVEEGASLEDFEREHGTLPSLHREWSLRTILREVEAILVGEHASSHLVIHQMLSRAIGQWSGRDSFWDEFRRDPDLTMSNLDRKEDLGAAEIFSVTADQLEEQGHHHAMRFAAYAAATMFASAAQALSKESPAEASKALKEAASAYGRAGNHEKKRLVEQRLPPLRGKADGEDG